MNSWIGVLIAGAGIVLVAVQLWSNRNAILAKVFARGTPEVTPRRVLSEGQRRVYWQLREAYPEHIVLCNPALAEFLHPGEGNRAAGAKLAALKVSFLLCGSNGKGVLAIFLGAEGGRERFRSAEQLLAKARIALAQVNHYNLTPAQLRNALPPLPGNAEPDAEMAAK